METSEEVPVRIRKESMGKLQTSAPMSLKQSVLDLGRVWSHLDRLDDPKASEWTEAEIVRRLIEAGESSAWDELGGRPLPVGEESLKAFLDARTAEHKKKQSKK